MPATESLRGGKQIAPMLRLLTSDLVLDEPDDFGLEDLPALCRLVNWAGMLGSRVLLSSATMPPSLVTALFDAYSEGRKHFNAVHASELRDPGIVCAWFDEYGSHTQTCHKREELRPLHHAFIDKRARKLHAQKAPLRRGQLLAIEASTDLSAIDTYAEHIHKNIHLLHHKFAVSHGSGQTVSMGVVRMANIDPMLAVAKALLNLSPNANYAIHYCVYHSQFPLALRSYMEARLDQALNRYDENALWQQPEIAKALANSDTKNHIFVVLGTSVVEVGRDHDYDWAIVEPSSMRALIQLAGRIQRHRQHPPRDANMCILSKNINALRGKKPAYCRPGFESKTLALCSHDLSELITEELDDINALPRMLEPKLTRELISGQEKADSFVIQEHRALIHQLFGDKANLDSIPAKLWWDNNKHVDWHGELIRHTPFRQSSPQESFILYWPEDEALLWVARNKIWPPEWVPQNKRFQNYTPQLAKGNHWWFNLSPEAIYSEYALAMDKNEERISELFGGVELRALDEESGLLWQWHPQLGVYQGFTE